MSGVSQVWLVIQAWLDAQTFPPSQSKLAERLGLGRSAVSAWKTGASRPAPDHLRALAELMEPTFGPRAYDLLLDAVNADAGYLDPEAVAQKRAAALDRLPTATWADMPPPRRTKSNPPRGSGVPLDEVAARLKQRYGKSPDEVRLDSAWSDRLIVYITSLAETRFDSKAAELFGRALRKELVAGETMREVVQNSMDAAHLEDPVWMEEQIAALEGSFKREHRLVVALEDEGTGLTMHEIPVELDQPIAARAVKGRSKGAGPVEAQQLAGEENQDDGTSDPA